MKSLVLFALAAVAAYPQKTLTIDDFRTGEFRSTTNCGDTFEEIQPGAGILGGYRLTRLVTANPNNRPCGVELPSGGPLYMEMGVGVLYRLELIYGVDGDGVAVPLNLDLRPYDNLRLRFDSIDTLVNFNVVVFFPDASRAQFGENIVPPGPGGRTVLMPKSSFVITGKADWASVSSILVIAQTGGENTDFSISLFDATN